MVKMKNLKNITYRNDKTFFGRYKQKNKNVLPNNVTIKIMGK